MSTKTLRVADPVLPAPSACRTSAVKAPWPAAAKSASCAGVKTMDQFPAVTVVV